MKLNKILKSKVFISIAILKKIIVIIFLLYSSSGKANENISIIDSANNQYSKSNYENAVKLYESIIDKGLEAPELYFNLGNAYYKSNNIAYAILNYERAKKLNPNDEDINVNLKLANQKIEDKIDAAPQLFLTEWKNGFIHIMTEKGWSIVCILSVVIALLLFAIYISTTNRSLKQMGFFGGSIFIILSVFLFFIAKEKYNLTKYSSDAIITAASVTATGSPNDKGTKLFILHEGTKVSITQEDNDWTEIKIANGNVGWIKSKNLTAI
jgi:tetratricopeptide (TPR) repeat protein